MKAIILLLVGYTCNAAIAVTAACNNSADTPTGATVGCSYTGTIAAGSAIAVLINKDGADTIVSVADNGGTNTYTATATSPATSSASRFWIYKVVNSTAITNPIFTVTFTTNDTQYRQIVVAFVTGVAASSSALDKSTCSFSNSSTVPDPGSTTLTYQNEAIVEGSTVSSSNGVGTGYTTIANVNGNQSQYKVVSNGTWAPSAFATANSNWAACGVTFTDAVGGGAPPGQFPRVN